MCIIPHLYPIRFVTDEYSLDRDTITVYTDFPMVPTLMMYVEAAAQTSAYFQPEKSNEGFLAKAHGLKLYKVPTSTTSKIVVICEHVVGLVASFSFIGYEGSEIVVSGNFIGVAK